MRLRRTICGAIFASSVVGVMMLDPDLSTGQPGGGGFGKGGGGGFGKGGGGGFGKGGGGDTGRGGFGKGGGGDTGRGGGGFGGGGSAADRTFGFLAKGGDTIDFSRMDANQKAFARSTLEKMGMPPPSDNTVITKAQFTDGFNRSMAAKGFAQPGGGGQPKGFGGGQPKGFGGGGPQMQMTFGGGQQKGFGGGGPQMTFNGGGDRRGGGGGPGGGPPGFGGGGYGANAYGQGGASLEREKMGGPTTFRMTDQDIERKFAESDGNRDGKLSEDELSDRSPLRTSFKESDTNQDGYIDLPEYKAYIAARFGGDGDSPAGSYGSYAGNGNYGRDSRNEKKEEIPVAIRYGKLPTGLPSWWDSLDTDKDGQVGLYEWRADSRDVKEFQRMDLDGDGIVAPLEWFRYNVLNAEKAKALAAEEEIGSSAPRAPSGGRQGGFGAGGGYPGAGGGYPGAGGGYPGAGGGKGGGGSKGSDRNSERPDKSSERPEKGSDGKNPFRGKK